MTRATFTIAAIAFPSSAAAQPPVAFESPCECRDNNGEHRWAVKNAHLYEVPPRRDHRDVDLISAHLPFGKLWYAEPNAISNAIDHAKFRSRSDDAVIRVYDKAGNVIKKREHTQRNAFRRRDARVQLRNSFSPVA